MITARTVRLTLAATVTLTATLAVAASAFAGPKLTITSLSNATVAPGGTLNWLLEEHNVGDVETATPSDPTCNPNSPPSDPACIVFTATVPVGLTAVSISSGGFSSTQCTGLGLPGPTTITCSSSAKLTAEGAGDGTESHRAFILSATVDPGSSGTLTTAFALSGGGAPRPATTVDPTRITATIPAFGLDAFDGQVSDAGGGVFSQAGGHPFAASTSIDFNTRENANPLIGSAWPIEATKDILVDLPPGFVVNPTVATQCTAGQLAAAASRPACPSSSQVGTTVVRINGLGARNDVGPLPVFNMVAPPGVPARFGFNLIGSIVTIDGSLRSASDYGLSARVSNAPEGLAVAGTSLTLWGVPADPAHTPERACPGQLAPYESGPTCPAGTSPRAFVRNPSSCEASPGSPLTDGLLTGVHVDSWANPGPYNPDGTPDLSDPRWQSGTFVSHDPPAFPGLPSTWGPHQLPTGCGSVPFDPTLTAKPAAPTEAASPSGFSFDLTLPQTDDPTSIGEGDLRNAVVTLPEGVRVNPSSAQGLAGCNPEQIGLHTTADPTCPDGSKLGTVTIKTPLLEEPLTGSIYLATPHDNPFNSLVAVYVVAKGPGVIVKLPGRVDLDPSTGRITTTFTDQPQLPFSSLHLEFDSGPRAPLTTPPACGTYTTTAQLTSWSGRTVTTNSPFTVDHGPDGGPCAPATFTPAFTAGAVNPRAGAFSPFGLQLTRTDQDQELGSLNTLTLPPGLLANVASVPVRCTDAQAAAASCPAESHIGTTTVGAGAGSNPFYENGDVYLTGPYKGAPFGLAIVVHAVAGPFDLGYVVVRSAIQIHDDGSVTTTTEPFPSILQGIPLQLRDVRVNLDRPHFMLNPTSCAPMAITGSVVSAENQTAALSSRFQVGECASLAFRPHFSASTQSNGTAGGHGASLDVKIATHQGPDPTTGVASEANIHKVDVQLPEALSSRLTTLNKACTEKQFAINVAGCPSASNVGMAVAHTPLLNVPLSGPAYLVSHGGAAFPDLVLVLQGEGVEIVLTGNTQIKKGITYSKFETAPDAPISSFELKLPEGKFSILGAIKNLCKPTKTVKVKKKGKKVSKLVPEALIMPTSITAQSGAVLTQSTKIAVTGCKKAKAKKAAKKKKKKK